MAKSIGTLGVEVTANDAELRAAMKRAADSTVGAFGQMQAAAAKFGAALTALGVTASVGGILAFARQAIDSAAALDDLAEKTGASVEKLSSLSLQAKISGTQLETVEQGLIKLSKAMFGLDEDSKGAGKAFAALGIDLNQLRGLDTADALRVVAAEMSKFKDGASKTALALDIFGKSGAQLLPYLKDLAEAGELNSKVTAQQAADAETLQKALNKFGAEALASKQALVLSLLPGLLQLADYMGIAKDRTKEAGDSFSPLTETFKAVAIVGANVAFVFKGIGREIGGIAAQMGALARGDAEGFSAISAALKADGVQAREELDKFEQGIQRFDKLAKERDAALAKLKPNGGSLDARDLKSQKQTLIYDPVDKKGVEETLKKQLEGQLKALERAAQEARDELASIYKDIDRLNSDNVISFRDYYDARNALQDSAVQKQLDIYDREIAALRSFKAKFAKENDKVDADNKINDLLERKNKLIRDAREATKDGAFKEADAFKGVDNQIQTINASVLEFKGNLVAAAQIRLAVSNESIRNRFSAEGNDAAKRKLDELESQQIAQARLNELGVDASIISDRRNNAESALNILQQNGGISELTSLAARSEARRNEIEQLEVIYQARLKIAQESNNPRLLQDADNLRAKIDELRASSNLLEQAFDRIFVGSAADAFASFISGAKSAKDAFKDFTNSVVSQISRLAAQDLANSLFKGGGSQGGGLFGFLSSFFGGGSGAASANAGGGFDPSLFGFANGGVFNSGLKRFANGGAFTNSIVDQPTRFRFANGAKFGEMGEAGPEAIMPLARDSRGRLGVRGGGGGGGDVYHFSTVIQTQDVNSFRQSEGQIAAQMSAMVARGRRNR